MEHFETLDASRLCLQVTLVKMLGSWQNNTTLSTRLSHHYSFSLTKQNQ